MFNAIRNLRRTPFPSTGTLLPGDPVPSESRSLAEQPATRVILYTRGSDVMSDVEYRSAFQAHLTSTGRGRYGLDDHLLAQAYTISAIANACVEYRATRAADLPLLVYTPSGDQLESTPADYFVETLSKQLLYSATASLLLFGRMYLRKRYNPKGWATGLEYISPTDVTEYMDGQGFVSRYEVRVGTVQRDEVQIEEMIYAQLFDSNGVDGNGVSKYEAAWGAINVESSLATHTAAFFFNSARPDGMLTFEKDISDDQLEKARIEWRANFQGMKNAYKTAVMPGGAVWTPMTPAPKDLASAELRTASKEDICAVMQTHPALIGIGDVGDPLSAQGTFNALEVAHLRDVTIPFIENIVLFALNTQWLHTDFGQPGYYSLGVDRVNIPALADANLTRAETAKGLAEGQLLDYNEARELIGRDARSDYFSRPTTEALTAYEKGAISLNEFRRLTGRNPVSWGEVVRLADGTTIPTLRYMEVVNRMADQAGTPQTPSFGLLSTPLPDRPQNAPLLPPARSQPQPITFSLRFAHHAFLRMCRRQLESALTTAGIAVESWENESDWQLSLMKVESWTPSVLTRFDDYASARRFDLIANRFVFAGRDVYVCGDGELQPLVDALRTDVENAGCVALLSDAPGIRLARLLRAVSPPEVLPEIAYPLVADTLTLSVGTVEYRAWQMRTASLQEARELTLWQQVVSRKGHDYSFDSQRLPLEVSTFVRRSLLRGEAADTVFGAARAVLLGRESDVYDGWLAIRAIKRTEADFKSRFEALLQAARRRQTTPDALARRLRELQKTSGRKAFIDGLEDGGRSAATITRDELKEADDMSAELNIFVRPFVSQVFGEGGMPDGVAAVKPQQWWNSIYQIYVTGLLRAQKNRLKKFRLGNTEKHCPDCLVLNGIVATAEQWLDEGLRPPTRKTRCGGHFCDCDLVDAEETQPSPGGFPTLLGPKT